MENTLRGFTMNKLVTLAVVTFLLAFLYVGVGVGLSISGIFLPGFTN
jgi:hypothetical protein